MTRRRLALAAALLLVVCGLLVMRTDPLKTEEEPLVGEWRCRRSYGVAAFNLLPDHRVFFSEGIVPVGNIGHWWVRDGMVYMEYEASSVRRIFRPLLDRIGRPGGPLRSCPVTAFDVDGKIENAMYVRQD